MHGPGRHFDPDPRPSRSPKLYAEVGAIPRGRKSAEVAAVPTTAARLRRLRMMAIILACRDATIPVPYSTLVATLEISERQARRLYKLGSQRKLRQARV
jgi:hypothetical protein